MTRLSTIFWGVIWKSDMLAVEIAASSYAIGSGIWFMLPFDTFHNVNVYGAISAILPEPVWGMILFSVGIVNLALSLSHCCLPAKRVQFGTIFFWVFTAMMLGQEHFQAWAVFTSVFAAIIYGWIYLRSSRRCRVRADVREELQSIRTKSL